MKKTNKILAIILAILMVMSIIPITSSAAIDTNSGAGVNTNAKSVCSSGHTQVIIPQSAPTETNPGHTVGLACSVCGEVLKKQEIIPALGTTDDASVIVSGTCGTSATWTYNTKTGTLIISGTGAISNYKSIHNRPWENYEDDIKSVVINNGITRIGNYAFDNFGSLIYVSIPDSVTQIGSNVFKYCSKLRSIVISDNVDTLNMSAFEGCKNLIYISLSNKLNYIEDSTFRNCSSLTHITVPDSVYYINSAAFMECTSLKSVTIGKKVEIISDNAFNYCDALTDVYYTGTEEQWTKISIGSGNDPLLKATNRYDGAGGDIVAGHTQHNSTITTKKPTCTEAGYSKFECECGYKYTVNYDKLGHNIEQTSIILPTTTSVGYTRGQKCTNCDMVTAEPVMVPKLNASSRAGDGGAGIIWTYDESTKTMEFYGGNGIPYYDPIQYASNDSDDRPWAIYEYSSVQYVIIHEGIKGINGQNFYNFTGLKLISLPSSLDWIGDDVFQGCKDFYIKYDGTKEDWNKIDGHFTNYDRIIFNDYNGVTASGTHGDNLTWIYDATTFTLTISGTGPMESVADYEYPWYEYIPEIENIVIKDGVTTIGESAFYECGFENITIPNTVTTIGKAAFMFCDNYKSIAIPSSVTKIGDNAFYPSDVFRYKLDDVYYLGTEEMWNNISMGSLNILLDDNYVTIHFIKYAGYCGNNLTWMFDGATLTISGTGEMHNFLTDNIFPDNNRPWKEFTSEIKHVVLGDNVTKISPSAFSGCENLESAIIGNSVTEINRSVFANCKSLKSVTMPDGLEVINSSAFYNCDNLTSIVIPLSVQEIGDNAFCWCDNIKEVHYPGTVAQWNKIPIGDDNEPLLNARIHYNSEQTHDHVFVSSVTAPTCIDKGYTTYVCSCGDTYFDNYVDAIGHTDNDNNELCDICGVDINIPRGRCGDNLTWEFDESTGTLTISGTGEMYHYADADYRPWEDYKNDIKTVIINDGVTSIGNWAFELYTNITCVIIGNDVTVIGKSAFYYCDDLINVTIGDSVTTIGELAFYECASLGNITLPDSVTTIDEAAFYYCYNLKSITIGKGVKTIGDWAFYPCNSLKDVYYAGAKDEWVKISIGKNNTHLLNARIHYNTVVQHYETVVTPPNCTQRGYTTYTCECGYSYVDNYVNATGHNYTSKATAPTCTEQGYTTYICECGDSYDADFIDALGHTVNDENVFCDICKEIAYPDTQRCGENVVWEFDEITGTLTIWGIGDMYDFEVDFGGFTISPFTDFAEKVKHIVIGDDVTSVGDFAFDNFQNLETIALGSSITRIGYYAFNRCYLLTNITLPDGLKEIDDYAFRYCTSLTNVTLPDSIEIIGNYAFGGCESFASVTIPISVQSIGNGAFYSCPNLKDVYYEGTKEQMSEILPWFSFDPVFSDAKIHYNSTGAETHPYKPVITPPTCTEQGYTTYTCDCGYSIVDNYVNATGHNYTPEITTPATHLSEGVKTFTCICGDTYTEVIEKITEHDYAAVVTEPTCKEQGYTTYTCECGDSYVADYVDATGHTSAKPVEDNFVAPTCTENGSIDVVVCCLACDEEISRETVVINATGHADNDDDGYCDADNELLDPSVECECNCHKTGISKFFFNLILFFQKLFGSNNVCDCGVTHY